MNPISRFFKNIENRRKQELWLNGFQYAAREILLTKGSSEVLMELEAEADNAFDRNEFEDGMLKAIRIFEELRPKWPSSIPEELIEKVKEERARMSPEQYEAEIYGSFEPLSADVKDLMGETAPDKFVEMNRQLLLQRSQFGLKKYGINLEREDFTLVDWAQHALEEALDLSNYLQVIKNKFGEVETELLAAKKLMAWFVQRCEAGEIRSNVTYEAFKQFLEEKVSPSTKNDESAA